MEDILASIKRIIAEDSEPVQRVSRVRKGPVAVPDPLEAEAGDEPDDAERAYEAEHPADPPAPAAEPALPAPADDPEDDPTDVLELTSPIIEPEAEEADMAPPADIAHASTPAEPILSGAAAAASRTAFAALTQLQVRAETGQENTLEGLVADLLRPMLRDYLDRELPGVVERLVAAEIQRVSGRG